LQPPQWSALLAGSAQSPPQSTWGGAQLSTQDPPTQASPTTHAVPQLPQFRGSLARSAVHVSGLLGSFPPSLAEQAATTNDGMPTRIKPRRSHRKKEFCLQFEDRMVSLSCRRRSER
jgi:hypothetical protein